MSRNTLMPRYGFCVMRLRGSPVLTCHGLCQGTVPSGIPTTRTPRCRECIPVAAPRVAPDALECRHNARGDEMPVIGGYAADDVQSDGKFQVARIEIHQMIRTLWWDVVQQFFG